MNLINTIDAENIVSAIAAILTTISFLPQAIKTIRTQDTRSISLLMYIAFTIGVAFWGMFGILINNYPSIIANIITFILAGTILIIKIIHLLKDGDK